MQALKKHAQYSSAELTLLALFHGGRNDSICVHSDAMPAAWQASQASPTFSTLNMGLPVLGSLESIMVVSDTT